MTETQEETEIRVDDKASEVLTGKRPWHPNSLANLRPFKPGVSGNPSGLCKDGTSPKARSIQASLLEHLAKPGGTDRLVKRWLRAAEKGSAQHLAMILERLYPTPQEDKNQGRQVLEGLRLELSSPGLASVTLIRGSGEGIGPIQHLRSGQTSGSMEPCAGSETTPTDRAVTVVSSPGDQASASAEHAPQHATDAQQQPVEPS